MKDFADSAWSAPALAANAFTEAIFLPVPPDPLLAAISIPQPHLALWLAGLATAASVGGAVTGYWLGRRVGRPALSRWVAEDKVRRVERLVERYGLWAVFVAAFTPVPYKVFAISAGVLHMDLRRFVLASLLGRGLRFFTIGALIMAFGEPIEAFLDDNFGNVTIAAGAAVLVAAGAALLIRKLRPAARPATLASGAGCPPNDAEANP